MGVIIKMRAVVITVFCLAVIHAQRPFGFLNNVGPKCADDSRPTCKCADGTEITRPSRNPCGDGTKPSCTCAAGSSPTRKSPCADGNKPVCSDVCLLSARMVPTQIQDHFPHALMDLQGVKMVEQSLVPMELVSHLSLQT